jgi:membrane protein CcdC involved in cytochrome C biogenesis
LTDTTGILIPIGIAAIGALIAIRLTFRNAPSPRDALFTPPVFAACGALIGISIGMLWAADREGRVVIEKGMLALVCGTSLGALAGVGAQTVYQRLNRGKAAVFVLVMMLVGGSIGAPIGWVVGSLTEPSAGQFDLAGDFEHYRQRWWASRMMWGTAIGSGVGLLLGLPEVVFRRRGAK